MIETPETAKCPYCKAMPMGMIAKVRWTCGSYGGPTGQSEHCKERASAWSQRDDALRERGEAIANLKITQEAWVKAKVERVEALREREELAALLSAEKATRNLIIEKAVKTERERNEARGDLEFRRGLFKVQEELFENARSERDELLKAIKNFYKAKGRHNSQIAAARMFELVGLPAEYPQVKAPK